MHDPFKFIPVFFLDWYDIATISLRHDGVLKIGGLILILDDLLDRLADPILNHFLLRADAGKTRGGAVTDLAMLIEDLMDPCNQLFLRNDERSKLFERRIDQMTLAFEIVMHLLIRFERCGEINEFLRHQDHVFPSFFQCLGDVMRLPQRGRDLALQKNRCFFCFRELFLYDFRLHGRHERPCHSFGKLRGGELCELFADLVELQCFQYILFHL